MIISYADYKYSTSTGYIYVSEFGVLNDNHQMETKSIAKNQIYITKKWV